ncbi:MAG: hypothetical protein EWV41_02105 [Microcystis wesenbergii Mw_MB_S_20031200_S109]|nr:MAG: hypothetical protein EWV41_02105 [Microcystis wesenbergii Mw_MB_S_20031200_S109]TRV22978.1 MAG: hypothetical protein EWV88_12505 [Microcystis wesenbergii Mw_MB_S_20031200_S109D]
MLLAYPPQMLLSGLIANLKSTSCQLMWDNYLNQYRKLFEILLGGWTLLFSCASLFYVGQVSSLR